MSVGELREGLQHEAPPLIGRCLKCHTEILASHPYSWCTKCNEPIPYRINMQRRPIMYGTIKVPGAGSSVRGIRPRQESAATIKEALRTFLSFTQK
jgi:hypothetical protein